MSITLSPPAQGGARAATVGNKVFPIRPTERFVHIRALVDRSIVKVFWCRGRAAVMQRVYPAANATAVRARASANATLLSAVVHEMGCGWVDER